MSQLIAFAGVKNSGKDTAANALMCNMGFVKVAFAEPIKFMLAEIMVRRGCPQNLVTDFLDGLRKDEPTQYFLGKTPRHAMETLGVWAREQIGNDILIDTLIRRVDKCLIAGDDVVVSDVRLHEEVAAIHELGGKVYRINRPGTVVTEALTERHVRELKVDGEVDNIYVSAIDFAAHIRERFADAMAH